MGLGRGQAGSDPAQARGWRVLVGCVLAAALLAGCTPRVHMQGHVTDPDALATIEPGLQNRQEVAILLGTPSAVATFDDRRWYYITRRTETVAFYAPELTDQQVTMIAFDENGVVSEVAAVDLVAAREIDPVDETTPTRGRSLGFFEQIFGNLGRPVGTEQ